MSVLCCNGLFCTQLCRFVKQGLCIFCRYTAAFKPVILLPGINHGHMSNGDARTQSGDLEADISRESAAAAIADTIVAFLKVHGGDSV